MTSAFPGAPGVAGGGTDAPAPPIKSGVVGNNDYLQGGSVTVPLNEVFPGYTGDTWQQGGAPGTPINPSTMTDPGHVSGGIREEHPAAFYPGLGQGV